MTRTTERVPFRLIQTPCCKTLLCWVNPRLPSYCPECGKGIYPHVRECIMIEDADATLKVDGIREPEPDTTLYMRLVRATGRMGVAAYNARLDPSNITVTIPFDYWIEFLHDPDINIFHSEERAKKFQMNGITVIRNDR